MYGMLLNTNTFKLDVQSFTANWQEIKLLTG